MSWGAYGEPQLMVRTCVDLPWPHVNSSPQDVPQWSKLPKVPSMLREPGARRATRRWTKYWVSTDYRGYQTLNSSFVSVKLDDIEDLLLCSLDFLVQRNKDRQTIRMVNTTMKFMVDVVDNCIGLRTVCFCGSFCAAAPSSQKQQTRIIKGAVAAARSC